MTYEEYVQARKQQIIHLLEKKLILLDDQTATEEIIEDSLREYEDSVNKSVKAIYSIQSLSPQEWQYEQFIQKVRNPIAKKEIADLFWNLELLQSTIIEFIDGEQNSTQREHKTIEQLISKMSEEIQEQAHKMINKYISEFQEEPQYIGSGESTTTFKIGNKVIKFGGKRQYPELPLCLEIQDQLKYDTHKYMYVTDYIETKNIPPKANEIAYRTLRSLGYIWVDPKPDNIGLLNGSLKILDDVDIYTEQDFLDGRKKTILEAVSYSDELAMLELRYQASINPDFNINQINMMFSNQSNQTLERINH